MKEDDTISPSQKNEARSNYEDVDDDSLWQAIANSDLEALSYAYKRYYNGLYFYGLKSVQKISLIEDSIQDLFLKLWDRRSSIKIEVAFKPYLFKMFRRIVIDKLIQLNKFKGSEQSKDFLDLSLSVEDLIINQEIESENLKRLEIALKKLSARSKEIIYLRFYEEWSYQQIADALDIKYQSVRNCVYDSIKLLRKVMKSISLIIMALIPWL